MKEAVEVLQSVVAVQEKTLAEDHPDRLTSQRALARAYQANGQIEEAITLLEYDVAIEKKTLAEDHPDRLTSQHALASAYEANGQVGQG
jgi:tetratricopeptide (TPR) repeat protein